ncbi:hypothetical protein Tco_0714112 [Tanacetum coccineum]
MNNNDSQFNVDDDQGVVFLLMDQEMTKANSNLESMPDDEIVSVFGFKEADSDDPKNVEELFVADEATADNMINDLVDMEKSQDDNPNVYVAKATTLDPLGHLQADITSLTSKVNSLKSSMSQHVADKIDALVPQMVADVFEERIPDLLADTLKNILHELLQDSIKKALSKFVILQKKLGKAIRTTMGKSVKRNVKKQIGEIPRDILVFNAKQLVTKVEKNAADIHELVELVPEVLAPAQWEQQINDSTDETTTAKEVLANAQGEKMSSTLVFHSSADEPPVKKLKVTDKGKGIAQTSEDDQMKQLLPLLEQGGSAPKISNLHQFSVAGEGPITLEEAKAQIKEIKRLAVLKAEK